MNNDYDFIKDKFDNDNLSAPDAISENEILNRLADKPGIKPYRKRRFKAAVSAAACLALIIGIAAYALPKWNDTVLVPVPENQVLMSFSSYHQIKSKVHHNNQYYDAYGVDEGLDINKEMISDSAATNVSHAKTYTQVDGVDESDIIKNDGKYIYFCNYKSEIMIYDGETLVSKIDDYSMDVWDNEYDTADGSFKMISDFYVKDDRLILCGISDEKNNRGFFNEVTNIYIYDITDIKNPKFVEKFSQSGSYMHSRMIGDNIYIISNKYIDQCKNVEDCYIASYDGDKKAVLPPSSIYCTENTAQSNYVMISAVNTLNAERTAEPKAFFGCGTDIYCNLDNLYLTIFNDQKTEIIKAELKSDAIRFTATGTVDGYVHNQFSMDESNGCFRIATSSDNGNNLYILDEKLNTIGEVTGFAKDETIQAVKYIGDMAYVITYELTDPLFVIDLSVPTKPVIKGSVEITGFSSQLVPVDENTILGIGYGENDFSIKLALFDISNASAPTVLDSCTIMNTTSQAQYNHKAIVFNEEKGYYAFDFNEWNRDVDLSGIYLVTIDDNKINIAEKFVSGSNDTGRVTYTGDTLYFIDNMGDVYSFNN